MRQLLGGLHPGQERVRGILEGDLPQDPGFLGALRAECSRMRMDSFDEYDGIIGRPPFEIGAVSPTLLESYVSCPFRFLASWRSAWGLERECVADVGSSPDPRIRGKIVHEAAEKIIRGHGFEPERETVSDILEEAAAARDLTGKLGAHYLSRLFVLEQTDAVLESLKALSGRGWDFLGSELDLSGELGGIPISGRIDLVLTDSDSRLVLVDLKTGSLPGRRDVTRGRYYQLPFYYILATQNFRDREIRMAAYASVSKATPGKLLEFSGSDIEGDLPRVMKYTEELVGMIRSGLFPPVASDSCRHCDLSGLCRNTPFRRIREKLASDDRMELLRRIHGK